MRENKRFLVLMIIFMFATFVLVNCKNDRQEPANEPTESTDMDDGPNAYEQALIDMQNKKNAENPVPEIVSEPNFPTHVAKPNTDPKPNPYEPVDKTVYEHLLNKQSVEAVLNGFFQAIEDEDQAKFLSYFDFNWMMETTAVYLKMDKAKMIEFFDVKEMKKALAFYKRTLNPKYADIYYDRTSGGNEVGFGVYKMTPKTDVGTEFEMAMKLKVEKNLLAWKIVEISWPKEYRKMYRVPVVLINGDVYELWEFRIPPVEYAKFVREMRKDAGYKPPLKYKYEKMRDLEEKVELGTDEIPEDGELNLPVVIPPLFDDIELSNTEANMIDRVQRGYLGAGRDFTEEHCKRDVVAALINIIIVGAMNKRFDKEDDRKAAMGANLALQNIFDKTSGRDKIEYRLRLGEVTTEIYKEAVEVIKKWIKLYKAEDWD